jgi:hypothetical protein
LPSGAHAASIDVFGPGGALGTWADAVLGGDLSPRRRAVVESPGATTSARLGLILGSPEFQRR